MEQVAFLIAAVVILVVITLIGIRNERVAREKFKERMRALFGKKPEKQRSPAEHDHIRAYFSYHKPDEALDDITWHDLGMDEVYARLNYCRSSAGEALLYHILRTPDCPSHTGFDEQTACFSENAEVRVNLQSAFEDMRQTSKYSSYDHLHRLDTATPRGNARHFIVIILLLLCTAAFFSGFDINMVLVAMIALLVFNLITYYREKREVNAYYSTFEYVLRLLAGAKSVRKVLEAASCRDLFANELETIRNETGAMKAFQRGSFLVMTPHISTGNPLDVLFDYMRILTHVDLIKFNMMFRHLAKHIENVDRLVTVLGTMDARIAVACFRASLENGYCLPEEAADKMLVLEDAYHPLVEEPVRNSITCDKNILITGSNASGKSTFLKTVAICAVLAQSIRTVPAKRYLAPSYRIYSSMALTDNLAEGESYYMVEIKSLKRILDAAKEEGDRVLCFIDEVLRGTNTLERIAASAQVLKQFASADVQCFAATHDGELTEILKDLYENYHFDGELTEGDVRFDYRLREGSAKTRNAIRLLKQIGYDDAIVTEAESMAARFLETGVWTL